MKTVAYTLSIVLLAYSQAATASCDSNSGLVWSKCLYGQSGDRCQGDAAAMSWVDALNKARGSEHLGITNWRLPKIDELETWYASGSKCVGSLAPAVVWSASANLDYATDAWAFDFKLGERVVHARDSKLQLLLVSGP